MPGPGRKPTRLKVISGTAQPCRSSLAAVELPTIGAVPDAPDWLPNAHAIKEWNRLAPILVANKLLNEAGTMALAHLCALHGKIVQLYAAGEAPAASLVSQYRNLLNDFGIPPAAQAKVKAVTPTQAGNTVTSNGVRPVASPRAPGDGR